MLKASIDLSQAEFKSYENLNLEQDWIQVPAIRMYLKARRFDISQPVFVSKDDNVLNFYQSIKSVPRNVIVIHPNPKILDQIVTSLKREGHSVFGFKRVKEANTRITEFDKNQTVIDNIVVPINLEVSYNYTYKEFLNKNFPKYKVLTIDKKDYRDTINMKEFSRENN